MAKAYWITAYKSVSKPDNLAAYAKLAAPALTAAASTSATPANRTLFPESMVFVLPLPCSPVAFQRLGSHSYEGPCAKFQRARAAGGAA